MNVTALQNGMVPQKWRSVKIPARVKLPTADQERAIVIDVGDSNASSKLS
jgi:hypothetical protein